MDAHVAHTAVEAVKAVGDSGTKLQDLAWAVLFFPLVCALGTLLFARKDRMLAVGFNIGGVVLSFLLSFVLVAVYGGQRIDCTPFQWLPLEGLNATMGLHLDGLTTVMLLVVTGVASLVMIFSTGYMKDDPGYCRFFMTLSLFVFSMLGIVLADNLVMICVFWELVGVSSYLLIGFWHEKPSAGDACKKAFLTNRIGDFGFMLGILLVWAACGTVNIGGIELAIAKDPHVLGATASLAGLLIFMGAMGKSAQFPLHIWLPDAMEGPTPVSALIHAATMVAAGVYMLCRLFVLYTVPAAWPAGLDFLGGLNAATVISWIGGFTALLAALIAIQQNDIKRILAYSTLSQLGYMVMAVGLAGPTPAMFHLTTHAFFKALLFLGAGSVIHGLHEEQNIWKMGGLKKKMPVTFWTFILGTLALSGVPPFSGFYSKDSIFAQALHQHNYVLFTVAVLVAALTTFYMFRLFFVAFLGEPRTEQARHAHESPKVMTLPLLALAVFAVIGGFIGISGLYGAQFHLEGESLTLAQQFLEPLHAPFALACGLGAVIVGLIAAFILYKKAATDPLPARLGWLSRAMRDRFYFDEIYQATFIRAHDFIASVCDLFDRWIVEGACIGLVRGGTDLTGRALRLAQTGNLQTYALLFALGVALVLYFALGK